MINARVNLLSWMLTFWPVVMPWTNKWSITVARNWHCWWETFCLSGSRSWFRLRSWHRSGYWCRSRSWCGFGFGVGSDLGAGVDPGLTCLALLCVFEKSVSCSVFSHFASSYLCLATPTQVCILCSHHWIVLTTRSLFFVFSQAQTLFICSAPFIPTGKAKRFT